MVCWPFRSSVAPDRTTVLAATLRFCWRVLTGRPRAVGLPSLSVPAFTRFVPAAVLPPATVRAFGPSKIRPAGPLIVLPIDQLPPVDLNAPPLRTMGPVPRALLAPTAMVPALTVTPPLNVLPAPLRVSVPGPFLVRASEMFAAVPLLIGPPKVALPSP